MVLVAELAPVLINKVKSKCCGIKGLLFAAVGVMALAACQEKGGYTINGTIAGAKDGEYVYMRYYDGREAFTLDSAIVKNGKFEFKGMPDSVFAPKFIIYGNEDQNINATVFVEDGTINVDMAEGNSKVSGTPSNDAFAAFIEKYSGFENQMTAIATTFRTDTTLTDVQKDSLVEAYDKVSEECMDYVYAQTEANINNAVGAYMLQSNGLSFEVEQANALLEKLPQKFLASSAMTRLKEYVDNAMNTVVGKKYIDFTMNTPEGETVKLSDFVSKNKYTLIDFWASWCGPCRQEMPNVVDAYKQFKSKGFGIVGVSLDKDADKWKQAIKDLNITWPQMSDLKAWQCEGAKLYGVRAIPATVLVDQEGNIVARDLRGEDIAAKLEELLLK